MLAVEENSELAAVLCMELEPEQRGNTSLSKLWMVHGWYWMTDSAVITLGTNTDMEGDNLQSPPALTPAKIKFTDESLSVYTALHGILDSFIMSHVFFTLGLAPKYLKVKEA